MLTYVNFGKQLLLHTYGLSSTPFPPHVLYQEPLFHMCYGGQFFSECLLSFRRRDVQNFFLITILRQQFN